MAERDDLNWARYNPEIIATACSRCGAQPPDRCKSGNNVKVTMAHAARIKAAGYRWSTVLGKLIRL